MRSGKKPRQIVCVAFLLEACRELKAALPQSLVLVSIPFLPLFNPPRCTPVNCPRLS
jgi:hypothetical protein